jgi:polysaccharide biosynthesis PFTS motif protein
MSRSQLFSLVNSIEKRIIASFNDWQQSKDIVKLLDVAALQQTLLIYIDTEFIKKFTTNDTNETKIPRSLKYLKIDFECSTDRYKLRIILNLLLRFLYGYLGFFINYFQPHVKITPGSVFLMDTFAPHSVELKKQYVLQSWLKHTNYSQRVYLNDKRRYQTNSYLENLLLIQSTDIRTIILSFIKTLWLSSKLLKTYGLSLTFQMLPEIFKYLVFQPQNLPREIELIYSASSKIYRPLWSYKLNSQNVDVSCYFYSTNHVFLNTKPSSQLTPLGFKCMTWAKYYVWDDTQINFFQNHLGVKSEYIKCGIINIPTVVSSGNGQTKPTSPFIAVFDVTPFSPEIIRNKYVLDPKLHSEETMVQFIRDVIRSASKCNLQIAIKTKRTAGPNYSRKYLRYLKRLGRLQGIQIYDEQTTPSDMIMNAVAVVSFPYTSTGLISKNLNVPSIYYDPTGTICDCMNVSRKIPLISNQKTLEKKFMSYYEN